MRPLLRVLRRENGAASQVEAGAAAARLDASPATVKGTPRRKLYAGHSLEHARTIDDLRTMARRRLPDFALEYLEGGAEEEATLSRNLAALASYRLLPRALVDVSHRDLSVSLARTVHAASICNRADRPERTILEQGGCALGLRRGKGRHSLHTKQHVQ